MLSNTIKKRVTRNNTFATAVLGIILAVASSTSLAAQGKSASFYQHLMTLDSVVRQFHIQSLLYIDGEMRMKDGMTLSIQQVDRLLLELQKQSSHEPVVADVLLSWKEVQKVITTMPETPAYSYFYLEQLSKGVDKITAAIGNDVASNKSSIGKNELSSYFAATEVLTVVGMHLTSATMDIGNDEASKNKLSSHCRLATKRIDGLSDQQSKVKSYVKRSWQYIQGPICKTGKQGGNYTIAHFSQKISAKLVKLYGADSSLRTADI